MQVLRQILCESVLLAVIGGAAGSLLAVWGLDLLRVIGTQTVPRIAEANLDGRVLVVMLAVSIGTGILFGIIPAFASGNPEVTEALKDAGVSARGEIQTAATGRVPRVILEAAREQDAGLIVMGSRRQSELDELFLESVTDRVLHVAECPVLVVG